MSPHTWDPAWHGRRHRFLSPSRIGGRTKVKCVEIQRRSPDSLPLFVQQTAVVNKALADAAAGPEETSSAELAERQLLTRPEPETTADKGESLHEGVLVKRGAVRKNW